MSKQTQKGTTKISDKMIENVIYVKKSYKTESIEFMARKMKESPAVIVWVLDKLGLKIPRDISEFRKDRNYHLLPKYPIIPNWVELEKFKKSRMEVTKTIKVYSDEIIQFAKNLGYSSVDEAKRIIGIVEFNLKFKSNQIANSKK